MEIKENHEVLLARIDERTRLLNETVNELKTAMSQNYVSVAEFRAYQKEMKPVKNTVFGALSVIVFTVFMAIIGLVIKK